MHFKICVTIFFMLLGVFQNFVRAQSKSPTILCGVIIDEQNNEPLPSAHIYIFDSKNSTTSDLNGKFCTNHTSAGSIHVQISYVGYITKDTMLSTNSTDVIIRLQRDLLCLKEVIITPGYLMFTNGPGNIRNISSREIKYTPEPTNDIFRVLHTYSGINSDYMFANFGFWGSYYDETQILLDGLKIIDPFHLNLAPPNQKMGGFSIFDPEVIQSVGLNMGGFPAKYGYSSGGVVEIKTKSRATDSLSGSASLSLINSSIYLEKSWGNNGFIVSARSGYLNLMMKIIGEDIVEIPKYSDLFFKFFKQINRKHRLNFSSLLTKDAITPLEKNRDHVGEYHKNLNYLWTTWDADYTPKVSNKLILYYYYVPSEFDMNFTTSQRVNESFRENTSYNFGVKNDFYAEVTSFWSLNAGADFRQINSRYKLFSAEEITENTVTTIDTNRFNIHSKNYESEAYITNKLQIAKNVLVEAGLRLDYQNYVIKNNTQISPRLAISLKIAPRTTLSFAYGYYYQPTNLMNLDIIGTDQFEVWKNIHYVVGLDKTIGNHSILKMECYSKKLGVRKLELKNQDETIIYDRGYSYGMNLIYNYQTPRFLFKTTYSYNKTRDISTLGNEYSREIDRPHAFSLLAIFNLKSWIFSIKEISASGKLYTPEEYVLEQNNFGYQYWIKRIGPYLSKREVALHRLDIGLSKEFRYKKGRRLFLEIEVLNLLNIKTVYQRKAKLIRISNANDHTAFMPSEDISYSVPIVPTIGLRYSF